MTSTEYRQAAPAATSACAELRREPTASGAFALSQTPRTTNAATAVARCSIALIAFALALCLAAVPRLTAFAETSGALTAGASLEDETAADDVTLTAPNIILAKNGASGFTLKWKAIEGAQGYTVQMKSATLTKSKWVTAKKVATNTVTITSVAAKRIPAKTKCQVRIKATAGKIASSWSKVKKVTTKRITPSKHIYSHRGTNTQALPHTFKAYDLAIKQGSRCLEQDVVLSKNGTLWVMHDTYLKTKSGKKYYFKDLTDAQVRKFKRANGERIHSLQSVFNRYGNSITYVVELKQTRAVEPLVEFANKNHPKKLIVQSRNATTLTKAAKAIPSATTLLLAFSKKALKAAVACDEADIVCMKKALVTRANVRLVKASGKTPSAFLLNSRSAIRKAIRLGIETYFTDNTNLAVKAEKEYRRYEAFA